MSPARHLARLAALLAIALGSGSCTLVKPVVGAITGPIYILGQVGGVGGHYHCDDGRAAAGFLVASSAIGAVAGLVTGVISDVQVLRGRADDPVRNWFNPFEPNTSSTTW